MTKTNQLILIGEEDEKKREEDDIITIQVPSTTDNDHEMISNDSSSHDIVEDMISLSSQPKSKWQTLLNIDAIKKRNKPKEAPKVPEKAPFFLPTVPGATPTFFDVKAATDSISAAAPVSSSKILKMNDMELVTEFTRILRSCAYENDCKKKKKKRHACEFQYALTPPPLSPQPVTDFFKYLTSLSPSAADFEIRSLSPMDNFADFKFFIAALKSQLMKNKDFELVQAYMNAFLKVKKRKGGGGVYIIHEEESWEVWM